MQKLAKQFIDLLEQKQLLSPDIIEELRRQAAESKTRLTPELLAKLLVDNGHLTKFQATKIIGEIKVPDESDDDATSSDEELGLAPDAEEELGFAPESETPEPAGDDSPSQEPVAAVFIDDDSESSAVEVVEVEAVEATPVEVEPVVEVVAEVEPVEVAPVAEVAPAGLADSVAADSTLSDVPKASPKPVRGSMPKSNPWDSFRILGVGMILAVTLIAGYFLLNWFRVGNAEDRLTRANDSYEQRSYETAASMYAEFAEDFPTDDKVSFARVRAALSLLRKDSEGAPNPSIGLKTAQEVLPGIAEEAALVEERSDLAGALISLAGKFNDRADATEDTSGRKELMGEMDQLLDLIENPQFIGANERNQQGPTLARIREDRQRILREINRDEELSEALVKIDEHLATPNLQAAYDTRRDLINRYPLLEANASLIERIAKASEIQKSLVKPGLLNPSLSNSDPATDARQDFLLGHRSGNQASSLANEVVFVRVKGSVFGLDAGNGTILWRRHVGREFQSEPLRLGDTNSDALICQPEVGVVTRVDGRTGVTKWRVDFGVPVHMPVVESDDLFVTSFEGDVVSLDMEGGQTKWSMRLPQPIEVAPGLAFSKPHLYLPAEHSNVYVLSRRDGSCAEVHYLGHEKGSISVPPILMLGQLLVFENVNAGAAKINVLATDENGLGLADGQRPILVDGNVLVSPVVDGRRVAVQSDLGQIMVLDVEPTLETQKVSILATIPKNLRTPRLSWSVFGNNKLWVADSRFTRFDLQVSLGRLNRAWTENDGDQFSGRPQRYEDVIIHTRRLRGNQGARVSAIEADSGQSIWSVDLGVPITFIDATSSDVAAVNSGGMLFNVDRQPVQSEAASNPGQGRSSTQFVAPVQLTNGVAVLQNASSPRQLAYFDPAAKSLQVLSANFGSASPSCPLVAVGELVAVGLDNGQLILVDPSNGTLAASPYQPPMEAGKTVQWNSPVYIENSKTLIVASDLQKLVRLSVGNSLRPLTDVDLETPLVGPLCLAGTAVCGVSSSRSGDVALFFNVTSLQSVGTANLAGRRVAGPFPIAAGCLIQTEQGLTAYAPDGSLLWQRDVELSKLVGAPAESGAQLIIAGVAGELLVLDAASGEVSGSSSVEQGFSSVPRIQDGELLIGSDEGSVLSMPIPTQIGDGN